MAARSGARLVRLLVVDDESERVVLNEEGVSQRLEAEGLAEAVHRVFVHLLTQTQSALDWLHKLV